MSKSSNHKPKERIDHERRFALACSFGRVLTVASSGELGALAAAVTWSSSAMARSLPDGTAALQQKIDRGGELVQIGSSVRVSKPIKLKAGQTIEFVAGAVVATSPEFENSQGVFWAESVPGLRLINPNIDASATPGVFGINIVNCVEPLVQGARLKKCLLALQMTGGHHGRRYRIESPTVDLAGFGTTAIYISGVDGCTVNNANVSGGKEGIGLYNNARNVAISGGKSYGHSGDGFVIIDGQDVRVVGLESYQNGQSGFATQRFTSAENCRRVTFEECVAHENKYDGFDLRGAVEKAYSEPYDVRVLNCTASSNIRTGFYIVKASGCSLYGCSSSSNALQGFFVDESNRVSMVDCRAVDNAARVPRAGGNKSGMLVYLSAEFLAKNCVSENKSASHQEWGLAFSGPCPASQVIGGRFAKNLNGEIFRG